MAFWAGNQSLTFSSSSKKPTVFLGLLFPLWNTAQRGCPSELPGGAALATDSPASQRLLACTLQD